MKYKWHQEGYWEERIGEDWAKKFKILQERGVLDKVLPYVLRQYSTKVICPDIKDVFKAFKLCPWKELKVVIIGQDPYHDIHNGKIRATGLAFANNPEQHVFYSPSLDKIMESVRRDRKLELPLEVDPSLESWAKQGVLLLNTALTVEQGKPGSHATAWSPFTTGIIEILSEYNNGLIFLLWGGHARKYKKYINQNLHHILEYSHPASVVYRGNGEWGCTHFGEVNEILKKNNNMEIKWTETP